MGKDAPDAPDYAAAAEQTAAGNLELLHEQTRANRPTQITPWGTLSWEEQEAQEAIAARPEMYNPWTGQYMPAVEGQEATPGGWTQRIELSGPQQQALEDQMAVQAGRSGLAQNLFGRVGDEFGDVMDWSEFTELGDPVMGGAGYNEQAAEALYGRATSRLDPQFAQRSEQLESQLRNQGLRPGDEAYDNAMDNFERERTDAYQQAGFGADIGAGQEASRMQGQDIQAGGYRANLRQQEISEEMQRRGFSLNEINAILSGQQIGMPGMPGFNEAGIVSGADYTGAARDQYSADMDASSIRNAAWNSALNAGAGAMSFSDIRLKRNVKLAGTWNKIRFYTWEWIWGGKGFGVMAHEMPPEYVAVHSSGYLMVDYEKVYGI